MLDKEDFLTRYHLKKKFELSGFTWDVLNDIYEDYTKESKVKELQKISNSLSRLFSENDIRGKHSVSCRCKDAEHLIEKIIRNATAVSSGSNSEKYKLINCKNYRKLITDLIGVRILVLSKEDWEGVHDFIIEKFENKKEYYWDYREKNYGYHNEPKVQWIVEEPKAYVRYGDEDIFKGKIRVNYTHKDYRSQHYVVKYKNTYCEIQVRTLAEEIYGEFDHKVRYPYKSDNKFLKQYTKMLSQAMVATDRMLSICMRLPENILETCDSFFEEDVYPELHIVSETEESKRTLVWGTSIIEASNRNIERRK